MPKQVTNVAADDALTTIYRLSHDEQEEVIAARVAERLDIKPASAAGMLTRLRRDKLVRIDGRKRIALSGTGFARAEQMVRRHRLAECLLVDTLGLQWWRAYEEAHLMEHAISDVTEPLIVEPPRRSARLSLRLPDPRLPPRPPALDAAPHGPRSRRQHDGRSGVRGRRGAAALLRRGGHPSRRGPGGGGGPPGTGDRDDSGERPRARPRSRGGAADMGAIGRTGAGR